VPSSAVNSGQLFANLVERMTAAFLDLLLLFALVLGVEAGVEAGLPLPLPGSRELAVLALVYMTASWVAPWHATPAQLVLRLRVVDSRGRHLDAWRAALRAVLVLTVFSCWFRLLGDPVNGAIGVLSLLACATLWLGAILPRRETLHDLVAGSMVVRSKAWHDPELRARLLEHPAGMAQAPGERWRRFVELSQAAILLGGLSFGLHLMATVAYERGLRTRTSYAISQARTLQEPISSFYLEHGRLPIDAAEIGVFGPTSYPDGGYFELEPQGVIRIRFERLPELIAGSIAIRPITGNGELEWECRADGDIHPSNLPAICRGY